jgi:equilibrative nucleoside transporter 1/2/3
VLTLVYQPFAVGTLAILAYNEAKVNTRLRNLFGYTLFFITTFLVLVVSFIYIQLFVKFDSFSLG